MKTFIVAWKQSWPVIVLFPGMLTGIVTCGGNGGGRASGNTVSSSSSSSGSGGALSSGTGGASSSSGMASSSSSGTGSASSSSSGTGGASSSGTGGGIASTATRPQLTNAEASNYTILSYLAQAGTIGALVTDNWDPTAGVDLTNVEPTYTVATDNTGMYTSVQAAITAAVTAGGTARAFILVEPGTYTEVVCVPAGGPPITLYGAGTDASQVTIVANFANPQAKTAGTSANPCSPNLTGLTYGTSGSATFAAYANDFQAANLTFQNDYDDSLPGTDQQAVALMTQGDRLIFDNVSVLGHQDSLYVKTPAATTVTRAYFKDSYIAGDVDFIFGRGTLVIDSSTIYYLTARQGTNGGTLVAPSTVPTNTYGFLVINSVLTADPTTPDNLIYLGRAWDEGVATGAYVAGTSPNGQALIRNSTLGAHIRLVDPWATSTSSRVFSATGNRLTEYENTGPGSGGP